MGALVVPTETETPLLVDAYALLALPAVAQGFELVAGWDPKFGKVSGRVQDRELVGDAVLQVRRESGSLSVPELFGLLVRKTLNYFPQYGPPPTTRGSKFGCIQLNFQRRH